LLVVARIARGLEREEIVLPVGVNAAGEDVKGTVALGDQQVGRLSE